MKRLFFILLVLPFSLYGQGTYTCKDSGGATCSGSSTHPFTFTSNGQADDTLAAVRDSRCQDGDTIRIGPQPASGAQDTYTWSPVDYNGNDGQSFGTTSKTYVSSGAY